MLRDIMEENKAILKGNKTVEPFVEYLTRVKIFHENDVVGISNG